VALLLLDANDALFETRCKGQDRSYQRVHPEFAEGLVAVEG